MKKIVMENNAKNINKSIRKIGYMRVANLYGANVAYIVYELSHKNR